MNIARCLLANNAAIDRVGIRYGPYQECEYPCDRGDYYIDTYQDCDHQTALIVTASEGLQSVVKLLLGHGADMYPGCRERLWPLVVSGNFHVAVVKLLLLEGAGMRTREYDRALEHLVQSPFYGGKSREKLKKRLARSRGQYNLSKSWW